jgi:hypothetical protein
MYEINGQWSVLGNRTLNNLDVSMNGITEVGVRSLHDAVVEQEMANEQPSVSDGNTGIYRINLQVSYI